MSSKFLNDKKKKLLAFKSTTNSNDSTAKSYLEKFSWDLMRAVDEFYANGGESLVPGSSKPVSSVSMEAVNSWFNTYVDPDDDEDAINEEGILKFCEDIGVDPQDVVVLVIAWKMGAAYMCAFTRKEWAKGMEAMDCDSVAKLKAKIPQLREAIASDAEFKKFYSFCFGFSKEPGQKSLSIDIATAMWELLLSARYEKLTKSWLSFLAEKNPVKGVTRDTWDLLIDFFVKVNESYDNYDENEAWPVLIDDYMAWIETKK
ncbi:Scaffold-type E3 ligase [Phytophthora boehmeriae]|uniref:Defective in cullin neddylation protein n=1 Tax=Phytophthora boehmeriae TaxID=109152 RepID=A0A8T1WR55_9STRA|nr:Scaffold-type E3 ligase [Phytophthora boehmeriae]